MSLEIITAQVSPYNSADFGDIKAEDICRLWQENCSFTELGDGREKELDDPVEIVVDTLFFPETKKLEGDVNGRDAFIYPGLEKGIFDNYYGVRRIHDLDGQIVLAGVEGFVVANPSFPFKEGMVVKHPVDLAAELLEGLPNGDIVFGNHLGLAWFDSDKKTAERIINPATGKTLRNVEGLFSFGDDQIIAWNENILYRINKGNEGSQAWLTPLRNLKGVRDSLLGVFDTEESRQEGRFFAFVYERMGNDERDWRYYLYKFGFDEGGKLVAEKTDIEIHSALAEVLGESPAELRVIGNKVFGKAKGGFFFELDLETGEIKTFNYYDYFIKNKDKLPRTPLITDFDVLVDPEGKVDLWLSAEVAGAIRIGDVFSDDHKNIQVFRNENEVANPYASSIRVFQDGRIVVGHLYLPGQFNDAVLTDLYPVEDSPVEHKVFMPVVSR